MVVIWLTGRTRAAVIDDSNLAASPRRTLSALHRTRRLDDIEYFVRMAADVALAPAIPTPGIVALAAGIAEGNGLGAPATSFQFSAGVKWVDHAAKCDNSWLVAWLMFKPAFQAVG